jgi:opacity protein-like surface antigen
MRRSSISATGLCLLLLWAACAEAGKKPENYVVAAAGGYFPQAGDVDDFDAGFNGALSFGHYLSPGFAFEFGTGYFTTSGSLKVPGGSERGVDISAVPLLLTLKGLYPAGDFEPYAAVGVGVYFVKTEVSGGKDDDEARVGFHTGLGANYNLTREIFAGVEGRVLFLRIRPSGESLRLDGITLTANLGYRF